ncbi:hypothetical protein HispidOSU_011078, partial [Sigmodon hispidus]
MVALGKDDMEEWRKVCAHSRSVGDSDAKNALKVSMVLLQEPWSPEALKPCTSSYLMITLLWRAWRPK